MQEIAYRDTQLKMAARNFPNASDQNYTVTTDKM